MIFSLSGKSTMAAAGTMIVFGLLWAPISAVIIVGLFLLTTGKELLGQDPNFGSGIEPIFWFIQKLPATYVDSLGYSLSASLILSAYGLWKTKQPLWLAVCAALISPIILYFTVSNSATRTFFPLIMPGFFLPTICCWLVTRRFWTYQEQ